MSLKQDIQKLVDKHQLNTKGGDYNIVDYLLNCIEVYDDVKK